MCLHEAREKAHVVHPDQLPPEDWIALKLQRLTYLCDDLEIERMLPCILDPSVEKGHQFHDLLTQNLCQSGLENTLRVDLFVPVRAHKKLFCYIIRIQGWDPTFIVFSTGGQLGWTKWKYCFREQMDSGGFHTGLYQMFLIFERELVHALKTLPPLFSSPNKRFRYSHHPLTLTGLSAGAALAGCLTWKLLRGDDTDALPCPPRIHLVMFGSPRFLSCDNVTWIENNNYSKTKRLTMSRYVNRMDPVPSLPTRQRGYCHLGEAKLTPDCEYKPSIWKWKFPMCHGLYYGISFLTPTATVAGACVQCFAQDWWIFLIIILVLLLIFVVCLVYFSRSKSSSIPATSTTS